MSLDILPKKTLLAVKGIGLILIIRRNAAVGGNTLFSLWIPSLLIHAFITIDRHGIPLCVLPIAFIHERHRGLDPVPATIPCVESFGFPDALFHLGTGKQISILQCVKDRFFQMKQKLCVFRFIQIRNWISCINRLLVLQHPAPLLFPILWLNLRIHSGAGSILYASIGTEAYKMLLLPFVPLQSMFLWAAKSTRFLIWCFCYFISCIPGSGAFPAMAGSGNSRLPGLPDLRRSSIPSPQGQCRYLHRPDALYTVRRSG